MKALILAYYEINVHYWSMKFLTLLVALFIFSVLLIAVLHDPQTPEAEARPDGVNPQPPAEPALAPEGVVEPAATMARPVGDIAPTEPAFFEQVGPRPRAARREAAAHPRWSPYVLDLSDRD
jgi:hypothetical protein